MSRSQLIKCKCGKHFAIGPEPYCYTKKAWLDSVQEYMGKGYTVEMIDTKDFRFEQCVCDKKKIKSKKSEPGLFNL